MSDIKILPCLHIDIRVFQEVLHWIGKITY